MEPETKVDHDVSISSLDERLQNVLGHFQKDFEGGISAENLGAKFGGYGSFLPTYQRSPVRSDPNTLPNIPKTSFMKHFDHLKIEMKDIISATNNFDPSNMIGFGGFGRVYKGELSLPYRRMIVAFKRLDPKLGQGKVEFWNEIEMLSKYKHKNLISLMHYCIQGDEMILTYEYAPRGSLDRYLSDASTLTWAQRLKICVGAAHGVNYLHDPMGTQQRVLHRDIKSANILLDDKWRAKVSDFGLSRIGPANQEHTYVFSNAVGTYGYCDPVYWEMGFLTKESDVYSFGVVLFEVLCGRLCFESSNGQLSGILVPMWRKCYDEKRLDEIILVGLKEQMNQRSLKTFSAIAYRCVNKAREGRPMMVEIVKELELALQQQVGPKKSGSQWSASQLATKRRAPFGSGSGSSSNGLVSDARMVPAVSEHWVCCEKCQKWRLLPPGIYPGSLPEKWRCSMLDWLPGMNRCSISEEETTRAITRQPTRK